MGDERETTAQKTPSRTPRRSVWPSRKPGALSGRRLSGRRARRFLPAAPGVLSPMLAGIALAFSSVFAVGDSLRLHGFRAARHPQAAVLPHG
ncbi:hypothetical protein [Streptomyces sp. NPDC059515]|uniref:hypothetical protein n=1 Tax=Streptomyces sp. NPDC059515 TaxID=3346854 RepID=UPI00369EB322